MPSETPASLDTLQLEVRELKLLSLVLSLTALYFAYSGWQSSRELRRTVLESTRRRKALDAIKHLSE